MCLKYVGRRFTGGRGLRDIVAYSFAKQALILLDYLLHAGSEAIMSYAKENFYVIKTLKEFQYVDEEGKDQGANGWFDCFPNCSLPSED